MSNMEQVQPEGIEGPVSGEMPPETPKANIFVRGYRWYENTVSGWCAALAWGTGLLGVVIVRRPITTILLSLLIVALCAAGWARLDVYNDSSMWTPRSSKAIEDKLWVETNYGLSNDGVQAVFSLQPQWVQAYNNNVIQLASTYEIFQVDAAIKAINITYNGQVYDYARICYKYPSTGSCNNGYLNYWNTSFAYYLNSVGGSASDKTAGSHAQLLDDINNLTQPDGSRAIFISYFAPLVMGTNPVRILGAAVIASGYTISQLVPDDIANKWYDAYTDMMKDAGQTLGLQYIHLDFIASNSVGSEIGRSISKDFPLIAIGVAIFFIVGILGVSRWDWVMTRSSLGLLGVFGAVLAVVAGYGLSMLIGQPFTSLAQVLPYILLGVTVDVMFILVKGYEEIDAKEPYLSMEQRFFKLMAGPGLSCTIVLLASAVAFALGATSVLPATTWFSVYACLSTVAIMFVQLTFFIAVFVLNERRIAANRRDCCCCSVRPAAVLLPSASQTELTASQRKPAGVVAEGVESNGQTPRSSASRAVPAVATGSSYRKRNDDTTAAAPPVSPNGTPLGEGYDARADGKAPLQMAINIDGVDEGGDGAIKPPPPVFGGGPPPNPGGSDNFIKVFFQKYYAPFLLFWPVRIFVLLAFIALCILCGLAIPALQRGQPISDLAPSDSFLIPYDHITTDTFSQQSENVVKLYYRDVDVSDPQEQGNMLRSLGEVLANPYINSTLSSFQANWLISFIQWVGTNNASAITSQGGCYNPFVGATSGVLANYSNPQPLPGCVQTTAFYPLLRQWFLLPQNVRKPADFLFANVNLNVTPPTFTIVGSFFTCMEAASFGEGTWTADMINSVRRLETDVNNNIFAAANAGRPKDLQVFFMYEAQFNFAEGDAALPSMAEEYAIVSLCGVGFVMIFVLVNPVAVIMMMMAIGMVNLFLYGEMYVLNIRFNQVSVINMIMATGLAVDYSVYWAQKFMTTTADGTRAGRVTQALAETGSAVFLGGITALLGSLPLAFSSSVILKTFFKLLWGTIIFALIIGLILVPVVFSIIGPSPLLRLAAALDHLHADEDEAEAEARRAAAAEKYGESKRAAVGDAGNGPAAV